MSNLPPGVTENMIPGNRPEDLAEEAFLDALAAKAEQHGVRLEDENGSLFDDDTVLALIGLAKELAYDQGFAEGRDEERMAEGARQQERAEREQWCPVCKTYHLEVGEQTDAGMITRACPRIPTASPVYYGSPLYTGDR